MNNKELKEVDIDKRYYGKVERRLFLFYLAVCAVFIFFGISYRNIESLFVIIFASGFYFSFIKYIRTEWIINYRFLSNDLAVRNFNGETVQFSLLDISNIQFDDKSLAVYIYYLNGDVSKVPCRNDNIEELKKTFESYYKP